MYKVPHIYPKKVRFGVWAYCIMGNNTWATLNIETFTKKINFCKVLTFRSYYHVILTS